MPLFILQKRAIRIINGVAAKRTYCRTVFEVRTTQIEGFGSLQTLLVLHKAKRCLLPHGLQTLFTVNSETSRRNNDF